MSQITGWNRVGYNYFFEFHTFDMVLTDNCLWPSIFDDLLPNRLCAACLFTQVYLLTHTHNFTCDFCAEQLKCRYHSIWRGSVGKSKLNLVLKLVRLIYALSMSVASIKMLRLAPHSTMFYTSSTDHTQSWLLVILELAKNHYPTIRLMPSFIVNCQLSATSTTLSTRLFWPHSIVSVQNKQHIRRLSATNRPLSLFRSEPLLPLAKQYVVYVIFNI